MFPYIFVYLFQFSNLRYPPEKTILPAQFSGKKVASAKKEKNLILEKIRVDEAVLTIQSAVRAKQARRIVQQRRKERIIAREELELYYIRGDLPADHARTIRTEGNFSFI